MIFFLFLFVLFGSHTWQWAGVTSGSVLRNSSGSAGGTQWDAGNWIPLTHMHGKCPTCCVSQPHPSILVCEANHPCTSCLARGPPLCTGLVNLVTFQDTPYFVMCPIFSLTADLAHQTDRFLCVPPVPAQPVSGRLGRQTRQVPSQGSPTAWLCKYFSKTAFRGLGNILSASVGYSVFDFGQILL